MSFSKPILFFLFFVSGFAQGQGPGVGNYLRRYGAQSSVNASYINQIATILPYVNKATVIAPTYTFSDTPGSIYTSDGTAVKRMKELVSANDMVWVSNSYTRASYLTPLDGSNYDFTFPAYKYPAGDIPHVSMFNVLDVEFDGVITGVNSPSTTIMVVRRRRSVQDEAIASSVMLSWKETSAGSNVINIANNNSGAVTVTGSTALPEDVWTIVEIQDNGASSQLLYNNVQNGSNFTLAAGTVSIFGMGTNSHIYEHDFAAKFLINGILTAANRTALYAELNNTFPIGVRVNKPYAYNVSITFDGTDTFNATTSFNQGDDGLPVNSTLDQWQWYHQSTTADAKGNTLLDNQKVILGATTSSLKRSQYPSLFPSPGNSTISVAARVKRFNTIGNAWTGYPLRSQWNLDNIAGTPDGVYAPTVSSIVINNALKTRIVVTYTGGSGTLLNTTSHAADWTVNVSGNSPVSPTSISFSGNVINLDFATAFLSPNNYAYPSYFQLKLTQPGSGPLTDTNNKICESFVSGILVNVTNNIVGPVTGLINLSYFLNTVYPGYNNVGGTFNPNANGTAIANVTSTSGSPSGISLSVSSPFQGVATNSSPTTDATYQDVNITTKTWECYISGNNNAKLTLSGFTANQTVRIQMALYDNTGGSNTGTISLVGATTINSGSINCTTLQDYDQTINADGSGNINITLTATNFTFGVAALIFTKF